MYEDINDELKQLGITPYKAEDNMYEIDTQENKLKRAITRRLEAEVERRVMEILAEIDMGDILGSVSLDDWMDEKLDEALETLIEEVEA